MTESETRPGDILVPDTEPPDRSHDNAFADTSLRRIAARVPSDLALTARLAWSVDPRTLLVTTAAQLGAAAATAFGLLATADVLTPLLAVHDRAWQDTVNAAAPAIAVLVTAASVRAVLQAVLSAASARLGPRVDSHAAARLLDTVTRADLVAYGPARFFGEGATGAPCPTILGKSFGRTARRTAPRDRGRTTTVAEGRWRARHRSGDSPERRLAAELDLPRTLETLIEAVEPCAGPAEGAGDRKSPRTEPCDRTVRRPGQLCTGMRRIGELAWCSAAWTTRPRLGPKRPVGR
ncbi:hypothetical protein [Embleya sp. NPDC050493]|uniref:hypothetical protein n=1 Tax=Embleya sp. NPDC050493 TaxID=3363989 RepID=UPI003794B38A